MLYVPSDLTECVKFTSSFFDVQMKLLVTGFRPSFGQFENFEIRLVSKGFPCETLSVLIICYFIEEWTGL